MSQFNVGDTVQARKDGSNQYEIMELDAAWVKLKKLSGRFGSFKIGDVREYPISALGRLRLVKSASPMPYGTPMSNGIESAPLASVVKFEPVSQCDCGGFKTYQSEADHYHSRWCFLIKYKAG